jgi:hypothetical protein
VWAVCVPVLLATVFVEIVEQSKRSTVLITSADTQFGGRLATLEGAEQVGGEDATKRSGNRGRVGHFSFGPSHVAFG